MSSVDYNMLISTLESTVVTEYVKEDMPVYTYQSEADLEREFIKNLQNQGYEYLIIHNEKELIANLKDKLEKLNNIIFSENEWERFFKEKIANKNESIIEKTRTIQEDYIKNFTRDNGTLVNISLIDKKNIHNNFLQVINQYEEEEGTHNTRYDVSILVNGLPLIHIELKRRGVAIREAFNQINRYQRDSFWAGSGLFEYVQIFVISNGTNTKYYSNTTRARHIKEMSFNRRKVKKSSNSFEFTSYWADANNKAITDLVDFTKTFFAKHTILNILTKYCIFDTSDTLLVMRPYQIIGEQNKKEFIMLFGNILKLKNILSAFDKFAGNEILSEREYQDYQSIYIDLYQERKPKDTDKESINDDIIFEIELIKQVEINIDYILMKVAEYYKSNKKDKEILIDIKKAINSSIELRSKKELIEGFIDRVNSSKNVTDDFKKFVREEKEKDLEKVIEEEKLKPEETKKFIDNSLRDGTLKTTGTDIDKLLPPVSRFGGGNRAEKKLGVIEKLKVFFDKYLGLTI